MRSCPKCSEKLTSKKVETLSVASCECGYSHHVHPANAAVKVVRTIQASDPADYPASAVVSIVMALGLLAVFLALLFI